MPDAPRHPIHRAADGRSLLVGYVNTATLYVKDGEGAALDLTGVAVTATVDTEQGRALAAVTAEVADAGAGAVALTIAEAEVARTEGRDAYLAARLDLGAGVVYEGQFPVFGEAGFAAPAEGSDGYVLPDLSLTVTAGEGVDVQAEWLAVRTIAAEGGLLPAGGTAGQALVKASGTDYDTEWADVASDFADIGGEPVDNAALVAYVEAQIAASEDNVSIVSETATTLTLDIDAGIIAAEDATTLTLDL